MTASRPPTRGWTSRCRRQHDEPADAAPGDPGRKSRGRDHRRQGAPDPADRHPFRLAGSAGRRIRACSLFGEDGRAAALHAARAGLVLLKNPARARRRRPRQGEDRSRSSAPTPIPPSRWGAAARRCARCPPSASSRVWPMHLRGSADRAGQSRRPDAGRDFRFHRLAERAARKSGPPGLKAEYFDDPALAGRRRWCASTSTSISPGTTQLLADRGSASSRRRAGPAPTSPPAATNLRRVHLRPGRIPAVRRRQAGAGPGRRPAADSTVRLPLKAGKTDHASASNTSTVIITRASGWASAAPTRWWTPRSRHSPRRRRPSRCGRLDPMTESEGYDRTFPLPARPRRARRGGARGESAGRRGRHLGRRRRHDQVRRPRARHPPELVLPARKAERRWPRSCSAT